MENAELIKIAIAALVGAAFKEFFALLIKSSKAVAAAAVKHIPRWIKKYAKGLDLVLSIGLFVFWSVRFWRFPDDGRAVTFDAVRMMFVYALSTMTWFIASLLAFFRFIEGRRKPNKLILPTPGKCPLTEQCPAPGVADR